MKQLCIFLTMMLMNTSLFAQWTKPVPEFELMKDDGETTQYLWNVGAKGFFVGHNDWNTRASVAAEGDPVRMKALEGGTWNFCCYPSTYINKNRWLYVSANAWNAQWVDASNNVGNYSYPGTDTWVIEKQANGTYKFTNIGIEEDEAEDIEGNKVNIGAPNPGAWGVAETCMGITPNTRCFFYDPTFKYVPEIDGEKQDPELAFPEGTQFWDEWQFVSVEEYIDVYLPKVKLYEAAITLKEAIDEALSKGVSEESLENELAVYNNTNSTLDELQVATASVNDKNRFEETAVYFENIIPGEKNDVSGVFVNNDFSSGNADGWDITYSSNSVAATNIGYMNMSYTNGEVKMNGFIEAWKYNNYPAYLGDGSITQTIPGLPAGKYMLAVDVIANNQGRIYDANNPDGIPDDVELFATASLDSKTYSIPVGTKSGIPEHFEFTFVHTGGSMTLGLRVIGSEEASMPANWVAMDNLQLFYYGEFAGDPDKMILDAEIARVSELIDPENMSDVIAGPEKAAYAAAIATAKAATENYDEEKANVTAAYEALVASVEAYNYLFETIERWENRVQTMTLAGDIWENFCDFVMGDEPVNGFPTPAVGAIKGGDYLLTAGEIAPYIESVDEIYKQAFITGIADGTDCTDMLTNPSFKDGFTGWINGGGANGILGGLKDYPCVEIFEGVVNRYQIIEGVPNGIYALSCKAFERPANNYYYDETTATKTFIYMNDFKTPVQNIMASGIAPENAVDYENCFLSGGYPPEDFYSTGGTTNADYLVYTSDGEQQLYVPNGMSGASYAFRAGRYDQKVYGLVDNGVMKIGISSGGATAHWVLWSNFNLVYEGKNPKALAEILPIYTDNLIDYISEKEDYMKLYAYEAAEAAIDIAHNALQSGDGEKMFEALNSVNSSLEAAKAHVEIVTVLYDEQQKLYEAIKEYESIASPDAIDAAWNLVDEAEDENLAEEDIFVLIDRMEEAMDNLRIPNNFDYATFDHPIDATVCIVNPSFETGDLTGWTCYRYSYDDTGVKYNENETYYVDIADGYYLFNTWRRDAIENGFWVSQTIKNLPAGYYRLNAIVASDEYNVINLEANDYVNLYEMMYGKETGTEVNVDFELFEGEDLVIKASSPTWFKADNFRLIYYGNGETPEILLGDSNCDGTVDVVDVTTVVDFILERQYPNEVQWNNSDVNYDGSIDVVDLTSIVQIILGTYDNASGAYGAKSRTVTSDALTFEDSSISLENSRDYVGFQMDVTVSDDAQFRGVQLSDRSEDHSVTYSRIAENTYRIVSYSVSGTPFSGNTGTLLNVKLSGGSVKSISNAVFSNGSRGFAIEGGDGTTNLDEIGNGESAAGEYYDLSGRRVTTIKKGGIYLKKGGKALVK